MAYTLNSDCREGKNIRVYTCGVRVSLCACECMRFCVRVCLCVYVQMNSMNVYCML